MIDMTSPQAQVAQQYMDHKGLANLKPYSMEKLEGQYCWYFYYKLPEGDLELEVSWEPTAGWDVLVTTFTRLPQPQAS